LFESLQFFSVSISQVRADRHFGKTGMGRSVKSTIKLAPLEQQTAPLRNKIIASLRTAIATGVLEPGARLVERDLCAQLGVSRTSLREALRELQADGVLLQTGARGLSVGIVSREEAENAYRIRAVMEALVVEQFIERASDRDIRELVKDGEALKAAYRSGDVARMLLSKQRFFERICIGADNALAFNIINRLVLRTSSLRSRSLARKVRQQQSLDETDAIVKAIRARSVGDARRAATAHVNNAMISVFTALDRDLTPVAAKPRKKRKAAVAA
jgi:DNA-binding GntR family transcriptional regulator